MRWTRPLVVVLALASCGCGDLPTKLTAEQIAERTADAQGSDLAISPLGSDADAETSADVTVDGDASTPGAGADTGSVIGEAAVCELGLLDEDFTGDNGWRMDGPAISMDSETRRFWIDSGVADSTTATLRARPWDGAFQLRMTARIDTLEPGAVIAFRIGTDPSALTIHPSGQGIRLGIIGKKDGWVQAQLASELQITLTRNADGIVLEVSADGKQPVRLASKSGSSSSEQLALHVSGEAEA